MFERNHTTGLPFATAVLAFAAGAALTFALAEAAKRIRGQSAPLSDDIILARVRARVAEVLGHEEAVDVTVEDGVVRLSGEVAPEERDQLLSELIWMPGVVRLRNALGTG